MIFGLLKKQVHKSLYKIVSFDIFDTLIERKQLSPLDVFMEVGRKILDEKSAQSFCDDRIRAEKEARETNVSRETTIDEIYELLRTKYADSCDLLKEAEIKYEIENCQRKEAIYKVYREAKRSGKRIIIITDMYLSRNTIENVLYRCGYEDFDALYISNEENASKRNGELFKIVFRKEKIKPHEAIHIGDSLKADYLSARKNGMMSVLIPRRNRIRRKLHEKGFKGKYG